MKAHDQTNEKLLGQYKLILNQLTAELQGLQTYSSCLLNILIVDGEHRPCSVTRWPVLKTLVHMMSSTNNRSYQIGIFSRRMRPKEGQNPFSEESAVFLFVACSTLLRWSCCHKSIQISCCDCCLIMLSVDTLPSSCQQSQTRVRNHLCFSSC